MTRAPNKGAVRVVRRWPYRRTDCPGCAAELVYDQRDVDAENRITCPDCSRGIKVPEPIPSPGPGDFPAGNAGGAE